MKIIQYTCNEWNVLDLEGQLDAEAVSVNRAIFNKTVEQAGEGIVVDLSRIAFLDSSGVGALVFMYKLLCLRRKSLILVGVHGQPGKLLQLLRLNRAIVMYPSIKAWVAGEAPQALETLSVSAGG